PFERDFSVISLRLCAHGRKIALVIWPLFAVISCVLALVQSPAGSLRASFKATQPASILACHFVDIASAAGIRHKTIFGGEQRNTYLLETTGSGVAFLDFNNDGWLDLFFVNGSRLEGFVKEPNPTNHLYRNNRDGTFTDVTEKAGLIRSGGRQGVGDGGYDNHENDELFWTYWGTSVPCPNRASGTL